MTNIAICDDQKYELDIIVSILDEWGNRTKNYIHKEVFLDGMTLINHCVITENQIDIVLLDIQMDQMNGIEVANKIREINENVIIIFVTNYLDSVFEGYKVRAFRYIMKDKMNNELLLAIEDALKELEDDQKYFKYMAKGKAMKIFYSNILYFESKARVIDIHTVNNIEIFYGKINAIEKILKENFLRCHQSYIVNLKYIAGVEGNYLLLTTGEKIPISESRKSEVKKAFLWFSR
ncbi:MAG: LytTR family DNA-binding domain-containing protein [Anaerocolumna sp.]